MDDIDEIAKRIVGLTEAGAGVTLRSANITWRVVSRDDEFCDFPYEEDDDPYRLNLRIEKGKVAEVTRG